MVKTKYVVTFQLEYDEDYVKDAGYDLTLSNRTHQDMINWIEDIALNDVKDYAPQIILVHENNMRQLVSEQRRI